MTPPAFSIHQLAQLPPDVGDRFFRSLSIREATALKHHWRFWARPEQLTPGPFEDGRDWRTWLILAGRGWGKTRTGAEQVREDVRHFSRVNLIGATADDARDIMIEGESGILAICPNDERPKYLKNDRQLLWPNGAKSLIFTADEPERLRGKQHERLWADELAAWRYREAWDQAMLGLRIGSDPRAYVTTTPRPTPIILELVADPDCFKTAGTTYANRANLNPAFYSQIIKKYEGTRLGRQELLAEILADNPDALWRRDLIEMARVRRMPELARVVVAVDPQAGDREDGAETGIIVCGLGKDGHGYVLDDASLRGTPNEWGTAASLAYEKHKAGRVVAEENQGGKMVEHVLRSVQPNISYTGVHAKQGKYLRAEPVAALYEQGKVHHIGMFGPLEDQLCQWTPGDPSPDRLDALVHGLTFLMLGDHRSRKGVGL